MRYLTTLGFILLAVPAAAVGPLINGNQINPQTAISISTLNVTGVQGLTATSATITGKSFSVGASTFNINGARVAIGATASPSSVFILDITEPASGFSAGGLRIRAPNGQLPGLCNGLTDLASSDWCLTNVGGDMRLAMGSAGNFMYVSNSNGGRLGILNEAPTAALDVTGSVAVSSATTLGVAIGAGTQLFYCAGGTFTGNVCRGAACLCTGGTATPLSIYVK